MVHGRVKDVEVGKPNITHQLNLDQLRRAYSPSSGPQRILVFNQTSGERDPSDVLERLAVSLQGVQVDHIIFPGYDMQLSQLSEQAVQGSFGWRCSYRVIVRDC